MYYSLFILILVIYILKCVNIYEYFLPDERQYAVCSSGKGETNIHVKENKLSKPLQGFFTSLIEETNEKNYNNYFKTPTCSLIYNDQSYFNTNNIINHSENEWKPLPKIKEHASIENNYSVLYPNIFNDIFVQQHSEMINNDKRF
tara:strand:+ start:5796 stop:6230 length:435 start_codon:yes stop_codon:yes gene_type:complete